MSTPQSVYKTIKQGFRRADSLFPPYLFYSAVSKLASLVENLKSLLVQLTLYCMGYIVKYCER